VPEVRLSGSYAALKGNAWFDEIDWVLLIILIYFRINWWIMK